MFQSNNSLNMCFKDIERTCILIITFVLNVGVSVVYFPILQWFPANYLFDITTSQKFDIIIMVVIMLNMLTMTMEHYGQTDTFTTTLYWVNLSFIVIFTCECVMKLLALRHYYFKIPWNVFDFVVVVLSVLGEKTLYKHVYNVVLIVIVLLIYTCQCRMRPAIIKPNTTCNIV